MKNARQYEKKIRKLLRGMRRRRSATDSAEPDRVAVLVRSVLEEDTTRDNAMRALSALQKEFVDFNELRVSPPKEIVEQIGKDYPADRLKADSLVQALGTVFEKASAVSMDYMEMLTKRDLRRCLLEMGLSPYAAACVVLLAFGGHAVPVDQTLVECLEMDGYVHPGSDLPDVQGFLERIIPQKDAPAAHEFLRQYVKRHAKALAVKHKADAARKKAEEEAAAAKAEAERKAAEEAQKKLELAEAAKREEQARQAKAKRAKKAARARKTKKGRQAAKARRARKAAKKTPK